MVFVQQKFDGWRLLRWAGCLVVGVTLIALGAVLYGLRTAPTVDLEFSAPKAGDSGVKMLFLGIA